MPLRRSLSRRRGNFRTSFRASVRTPFRALLLLGQADSAVWIFVNITPLFHSSRELHERAPRGMAQAKRRGDFTEALRLARNVSTENRALALAQLSAHMTEPMLQEALEEALAPGTRLRQQVLDELAPRLSDSLIRQALNSLQAIDDFKNQQLLPWLLLTAGDCEAGLDAAAQLDTSFKYSPFTAALTQFVDRLTQPALVVCNLESGTSIC